MQAKPIPPFTEKQLESFWSRVEVHQPAACWEWIGRKTNNGYGDFSYSSDGKAQTARAHRIAYTILIGPIPEGMQPDHLCRNRACINPDHIELVSDAENVLRGYGPSAMNARKTHCKRGHEFMPENTITGKGGRRHCRTCIRMREQENPRRGRYKRKTDAAKIRERDAIITTRYASGDSMRTIARALGIGVATVYRTVTKQKGT